MSWRVFWVVAVSFFAAFVLAVFPLPRLLDFIRPEWVAMTVIFWMLAQPERVGLVTAFCMGLLLDALEGHLLGQSAFALTVLAYLVSILYQRLRLYNPLQQSAMILVLVGTYQLVHYWSESFILGRGETLLVLPSIASAIFWPVWHGLLGYVQQQLRIH